MQMILIHWIVSCAVDASHTNQSNELNCLSTKSKDCLTHGTQIKCRVSNVEHHHQHFTSNIWRMTSFARNTTKLLMGQLSFQ